MTKLSSKTHLFIIIGVLIIAIGMAVGTVCHFIAGGFFNYGDEFAGYRSVTVSYLTAEQNDEAVNKICVEAFGDIKPVEVSYAKDSQGASAGEVTYRFSEGADETALTAAVAKINEQLAANDGLSVAHYHQGETLAGGERVLMFTGIAVASAAVFQAIYFALRYKIGMALTALATHVHNVGIYVALLAATRIPVGVEAIAFAAIVSVLTLITSCVYFSKLKASVKDEANAKVSVQELIGQDATATYKLNSLLCAFVAVLAVVLAVIAAAAASNILSVLVYVPLLLAALVCWYGFSMFNVALYGGISKLDVKSKS